MDLQEIGNEELLQMYANARATCSCGGHWKGSQNEWLRKEYAVELGKRDIKVPKTLDEIMEWNKQGIEPNVEIPEGVFNGKGSY